MAKNLIVTITNKKYLNMAKQLFASIYINSGFDGDYMIISNYLPKKDIKKLEKKGIIVKIFKDVFRENYLKRLLSDSTIGVDSDSTRIAIMKFYIFSKYFKKYDNIVYLDSDIIVRKPLNLLFSVKGFYAIMDNGIWKFLKNQFILKENSPYLFKDYNLRKKAFNSGVMAFSTDIIKNNSFKRLKELFVEFNKSRKIVDQGIINLYFYGSWKELPKIYNYSPYFNAIKLLVLKKQNSVILHSCGDPLKPWNKNSVFYEEWKYNLSKFKDINFKIKSDYKNHRDSKTDKTDNRFLEIKIILISFVSYPIIFLDCKIGQFGIFIKKKNPLLYYKLKFLIDRIKR